MAGGDVTNGAGTTATGESRTRRVLDDHFVEGLADLPVEELRRRRDQALSEREFQSYLRRLVQGRQDLLRAEQARRAGASPGSAEGPLVDRLTSVLSMGERSSASRGEAMSERLSEEDIRDAERRADAATGGGFERPEDLSDERLALALASLQREERVVSDARAAVFKVHDLLQDELKRRYKEDPSIITGGV